MAEQLERWSREVTKNEHSSPWDIFGVDADPGSSPAPHPPAGDSVDRKELRARLESIRASGPGAAAELLAAEDADIQAALLRRLDARSQQQSAGWFRMLGWFLAPLVPCAVSVLVTIYGRSMPGSVGLSSGAGL